jgi:hypothetical protein
LDGEIYLSNKWVSFTFLFFILATIPIPTFAHNLVKKGGHVDVKELLLPDDDISQWEKVLLYGVNGLLILFSIILISMLIHRKKSGVIFILFLLFLAIDYLIVVHYGSLLDLLG